MSTRPSSLLARHPTLAACQTQPEGAFALLAAAYKNGNKLPISTSGRSKNISNAVITAKAFGLKSIALTGKSGGDLAPLADFAIKVLSGNVAEIQELHLPVYHWLSTELEAAFFPE